jgi:hypothetical protein
MAVEQVTTIVWFGFLPEGRFRFPEIELETNFRTSF